MKERVLAAAMATLVLSFTGPGIVFGAPQQPKDPDDAGARQQKNRKDGSVMARGVLQCASYLDIHSSVGATILSVAPEGAVRKGDLLVELDSSEFENRLNRQKVAFEQASAKVIQAKRTHEATELDFEVGLQACQRRVMLAELALQKSVGAGGQHEVQLKAAEGEIKIAEKRLSIAERRLAYLKEQEGVVTAAAIDEAELVVLEAKTALDRSQADLNLLRKYEHVYRQAELTAEIEESKSELARAKHERAGALEQVKAEMVACEAAFEIEKDKLERSLEELKSCRIYAPQDGMILHANADSPRSAVEFRLEAGATVRERQTLIRFPDLSRVQLSAVVPETEIERVRVGQSVSVTIDAFPDRRLSGRVTEIGRKAQPRGRPTQGVQQFAVTVSIAKPPEGALPGLTGTAEIDVSEAD